jgi:hypothetical protein
MAFFGITNIWQKSCGSRIFFLGGMDFPMDFGCIVSNSSMFYFICSIFTLLIVVLSKKSFGSIFVARCTMLLNEPPPLQLKERNP